MVFSCVSPQALVSPLSSVCVCVPSFFCLLKTPVIHVGPSRIQYDFLTWLDLQKPCFQIRLCLQVLEISTWIYLLGTHHFLIFWNLKFLLPYWAEKFSSVHFISKSLESCKLWYRGAGNRKEEVSSPLTSKKVSKCFPKQNHFSPKEGFYSTTHLLK